MRERGGEGAVRASDESLRDVFALMEPGGFVERPLDMGMVFSEPGERGRALWSQLYLAGYLTTVDNYDRRAYDCQAPGPCIRYGVAFCGKAVAVAAARA